jgi:hypothetical protein
MFRRVLRAFTAEPTELAEKKLENLCVLGALRGKGFLIWHIAKKDKFYEKHAFNRNGA